MFKLKILFALFFIFSTHGSAGLDGVKLPSISPRRVQFSEDTRDTVGVYAHRRHRRQAPNHLPSIAAQLVTTTDGILPEERYILDIILLSIRSPETYQRFVTEQRNQLYENNMRRDLTAFNYLVFYLNKQTHLIPRNIFKIVQARLSQFVKNS